MPVPKPLSKKGQVRQMSTNENNHCGIDLTNSLTCWGDGNGHQFKYVLNDEVK